MTKDELKEYLKRDDLIIEGNKCRWEINTSGPIKGKYLGNFVFKTFLTGSEQLAVGRLYRQLLGKDAILATEREDSLAFTLSQLKYRVVEAPPFFTSSVGIDGLVGDIPDTIVLDAILEAALSSEFKYLAQLEEKKEKMLQRTKKTAEAIVEERDEAGEPQEK